MSRRLKQAAVAFVVVFAAAQLVRPERGQPATGATRAMSSQPGTSSALAAVLARSCGDCHSDATTWPRSARIPPLSWLMAYGLARGREAADFSQWASYSPERQRSLLAASCAAAKSGRMPGAYALLRPQTRLSARDVAILCTTAP